MMNNSVYLIDGMRTPFLKAMGKPNDFRASDLGVACSRGLLNKSNVKAELLDEVIFGCVSSGVDEANIARVIALRLGCSEKTPAWTVQRNCASGMQAIDSAAKQIQTGRADLILAGGTEAMSHHPIILNQLMVAWLASFHRTKSTIGRVQKISQLRPQHLKPIIALLRGLTDATTGLNMGQTAEKLASRFDIFRHEMDEYAVQSHARLNTALEMDFLVDEIQPIFNSKGDLWDSDEGLRADSSVEKLAKLKPVFDRPVGRVTAGNSAQVTDGAASVVLASAAAVKKHDLKVLGEIVDSHWAGLDPTQMGLGPVYAMAPIMQRQNLGTKDIDVWEINEAFAAQVLACKAAWQDEKFCQTELGQKQAFSPIPSQNLNIDGGGVSLGHPVGASGARIVLHALNILKRTNGKYGMASLCIGGGQGGAMLVKRVETSEVTDETLV